MTDEIDTSYPERIGAGKNLTFTRYMVPSGKGVMEHPQGMLYLRADVDPLLDKLEAERDAERARAEKAEAKAKRLRRAATRAGACLVAAISLLREGGRLATPSDKMFNQMLEDYQNAVEGLRATLRQDEGGE